MKNYTIYIVSIFWKKNKKSKNVKEWKKQKFSVLPRVSTMNVAENRYLITYSSDYKNFNTFLQNNHFCILSFFTP